MNAESVEKLRELNINVFKVEPKTLDDAINEYSNVWTYYGSSGAS